MADTVKSAGAESDPGFDAASGAGSGRSARSSYWALAACVLVTAGAAAAAVRSAPEEFRIPLASGLAVVAVVLCAAVTAAVYYRTQAGQHRDAAERATEASSVSAAEAAARIAAADEAIARHAHEEQRSEGRRVAALSAFAGAAGRMQAMTTGMLAELREMEHRHADSRVLADLLQLDHRTAQAGRLADSIAVLSGARTGRRWAKPIAMESILRGAMGRVAGYQRVRLRAVAGVGVAGHAAEGVMHALAELLDNACNFSPPTTEVHVYAAEVPAGVVITIEDSGLVMSESALRRAERAVSGADAESRGGVDLSSLTGTRFGLAVVGHLARKHGLTVSYRPSAIGGTAVVVIVPRDLITRADGVDRTSDRTLAAGPPASITTPAFETRELPVANSDGTASFGRDDAAFFGRDGDESSGRAAISRDVAAADDTAADSRAGRHRGAPAIMESRLPKRRRGSTLAAVHPEGVPAANGAAPAAAPVTPAVSPPTASAMGAFQRAVTGRDPVDEQPETGQAATGNAVAAQRTTEPAGTDNAPAGGVENDR
ncbi:sensor histidine kinase [Nocardia mexicana]|uniref:histidine kinase n=1 Tax=Nocardia mexicana TaxID=279262 RepID=A0A370GNT5_9NOCA|nr:ATP-binding protein [Nocardia mexicana]RDI44989.1 signal transduction histidine kinase [Nocardia mexicana]